jgi:hypothetical protein
MDAVELRRFEIKSTLIREQERKETLKVKHFNNLISASEIEMQKKQEKITGLKESINKVGVDSEPIEKLKTVKFLIGEIRSAHHEKKGVEKMLVSLTSERAGIIDNILSLKNRLTKIDGFVADKKIALKLEAESANLQDILETKVGAQRAERLKEGKNIEEEVSQTNITGGELLDPPASIQTIEQRYDASASGNINQDNKQSSAREESARPQNPTEGRLDKVWQDIRSEVRGIESKSTDAGSEVSLTLNGGTGNDLKVKIEKRGEKVVRVMIETFDSIDQRKLWAKKSEIMSALNKAGYTVESVNVGGVKS